MSRRRHVQLRVAVRGPFRAPPSVLVAGELTGWDAPIPVDVRLDAEGAARGVLPITLPPGIFAWKLLVDGRWQLGDEPSRTRSSGGHQNHLLAVDAAAEPVLFAPGRPWLFEEERGGVTITAGLRRGAGGALAVVWREPADAEDHVTPMAPDGEEDEHLFFRARLPVSSGRLSVRFALADGSRVGAEERQGEPLSWEAPETAPPAWWRRSVVYTVFVDRFRPRDLHAAWERDPGPRGFSGGHLDGVTAGLPALAEIGVNVVYLTPIHVGASCHRYDIVDPTRVDPRLGGEGALARLLSAAHDLGMRVLLDFTCSHAGRGFPPYEDVRANGRRSRFAPWFRWDGDALVHYGTRTDAPLFDTGDVEVRAYFLDLARRWAETGVDGLRLDAADQVPFELAREIRRVFRAARADGIVVGEIVSEHTHRFLDEEAGDAVTEMGFHGAITAFLAEGTLGAEAFAKRIAAVDRGRGAPAHGAVKFLSTHDHPRFATLARHSGRTFAGALGLAVLFTLPGIPMLLYGEEVGLSAVWPERLREHVWPDRVPLPWQADAAVPRGDASLRSLVADLATLRRKTPALVEGELRIVHAEGDVLVYRRTAGGDVIDVALNAGPEVRVELEDEEFPVGTLLLAIGDAALHGDACRLGRGSAVIVRRSHGPRRRLRLSGTATLRDRGFVAAAIAPQSRPSRLDFAVTERCNLRCAHCITHAPERTAARSARTLSPWLLDHLRDDLAHAEHFAFVHGGESLVSPMLWETLRAIRDARRGLPSMVHLLTNGALLSPETARRLADEGVRSISVSIDGATAAVNDAIREGGRLESVVANVRGAVRLRRDEGLDLRIGVSAVVLSQNTGELGALVDLCADMGVDWLKLEEGVPATAFAARSLVRLDSGPAADAVAAARARGRARGLVVVDHTVDRPVWRCRLDADAEGAAFLEADGFANRTLIHPCRGAWEIACVEANGDVRLGHFFGPVLGNLAEAPLASLWNNDVARAARRAEMAQRPCREGPVSCLG